MTHPILLIGSGNRDKARELRDLLEGLPWEVKSLTDYDHVAEPEEDGETFEENAVKKARYYGALFGVACVADDSGLCVDYRGGAPGIYSARYAGPGCSYKDNNEKLLKALEGVPWHERSAKFVCCCAFVRPGGEPEVMRGEVTGHIAAEPHGENGFGYDPVFVPDGREKTFGEMEPEAKNGISHRGLALGRLRAYLESAP